MGRRLVLGGWALLTAPACTGSAPPPASDPPPSATKVVPGVPPSHCPGAGEVVRFSGAFTGVEMDAAYLFLLAYEDLEPGDMAVWRVDRATHERKKIASLPHGTGVRIRADVFAIDDTHVYYAGFYETWLGPTGVFKLPRSGGAAVKIAHANTDIARLTADRGQAFFVSGARAHRSGTLISVDAATNEQRIVATDIGDFRLGVDTIYWTRGTELYETPRAGGKAKRTAFAWTPEQVENWIGGVSHDRDAVWWYDDDDALRRAPKNGGPPQVLLHDGSTKAFAHKVVGNTIYWTDHRGALWRMPVGAKRKDAELLDRRGDYDGDDYPPVLLTDGETVYWQAGADLDRRATDLDPLALYYYCSS